MTRAAIRNRPQRAFALFACLAAILTGCRERANTDDRAIAGSDFVRRASVPYRGSTVRVIGEAQPPLEAIRQLAADFTTQTGIKVDIDAVGYDLAIERATLDVQSGTGRYDIILLAPEGWGRFAEQGRLLSFDSLRAVPSLGDTTFDPQRDLFPHVASDLGMYNGERLGYPLVVATMNVWYRRDLFEDSTNRSVYRKRFGRELAPPATWQEYRDIAEFFNRPSQGLYGTLLQAKRHPALWQEWLNVAYSFGGGILKKANAWEYGTIVAACEETRQATEYYLSLREFAPPGITEYTWDDALALMQQGKVAMALMWTDMSRSVEDTSASRVAGKMGYAPPPAGPAGVVSQISGYAALIPRSSRNVDAAFLFIQWLLQPENQVRYQLLGGQSAYRAVYRDSTVLRRLPYASAVAATLERGISMRETIPEAQAVGDKAQVRLSQILAGERPIGTALDSLAVDVQSAVKGRAPLACTVGGRRVP